MPPQLQEEHPLSQAHQNMMFMMGQLNRQWRRVVDRRLRPLGLTEATWLPLMHLERAAAPMRQKDLAASLGLDSSSVVRLLDGLEEGGLITRGGHADRRAKTIDVTPRGQETIQHVKQLLEQDRSVLFSGVGDDEVLAAFAVMHRMGGQLQRLELGAGNEDAAGAGEVA